MKGIIHLQNDVSLTEDNIPKETESLDTEEGAVVAANYLSNAPSSDSNPDDTFRIRNLEDQESVTSSIQSESEFNFIGQDYPIENTFPVEESSTKARVPSGSSSVNSETFIARDRASLFQEERRPYYDISVPEENLWLWVSGGGCLFQPHNMPKW